MPEGALSQRRKNGLIADVHNAVVAAAGLDPNSAQALPVWTLIRAVPQGNWGAAGQAQVHVAQPGVSAQIRRLERELGQPLFDRSGRTVRLTEIGGAVLPTRSSRCGRCDAVEMVSSSTACDVDLPGLLADFHRDYPDVEITLSEDKSDGLVEALQAGIIGAAFVPLDHTTPQGTATVDVRNEILVAAVGLADPFTARTSITLAGCVSAP